jgi:hypothetical protein
MFNYTGDLVKGYYECLRGNLNYLGDPVKVYNVYVPKEEKFHHVIVRPESESDGSNKRNFMTRPVVVVEVYTVHDAGIDAGIVEDIDNQVKLMLQPNRNAVGPHMPGHVQLVNMIMQNATYLEGFNGSKHEHRKITRYINTLNHK